MEVNEMLSETRQFVDELDKYRLQWESYTHWFARKTFLRHNWETSETKTKLISLSNVYANHHFMGNRYPPAVMKKLSEMEEGMENARELLKIAESYMNGKALDYSPSKPSNEILQKLQRKLPPGMTPMIFVKESKTETLNSSFNNLSTNDNPVFIQNNDKSMNFHFKKDNIEVENTNVAKNQNNWKHESMETLENKETKLVMNNNKTSQVDIKKDDVKNSKPFNLLKLVNKPSAYSKVINKKASIKPQNASTPKKGEKPTKHHADDAICKKPSNAQKNHIINLAAYINVSVEQFKTGNVVGMFNQYAQSVIRLNPLFVLYQLKGQLIKNYNIWTKGKNISGIFTEGTWFCDLFVSDVFLAHGHGTGKNLAKTCAVKGAVHLLSSDKVFVVSAKRSTMDGKFIWQVCASLSQQTMEEGTLPPITATALPNPSTKSAPPVKKLKQSEPKNSATLKINQSLIARKFSKFVIRERTNSTPVSTINESAQFNHLPFEYDVTSHMNGQFMEWKCVLLIDGVKLGLSLTDNQKSAKHEAATVALNCLKSVCPTVVCNNERPGNQDQALSRNDVSKRNGDIASNTALDENNLGNQLLRKMGWSGTGGIGKYGEGRTEPVQVFQLQERAGLGNQSTNQEKGMVSFKDAQTVLKKYVADGCQGELTFSPELTSDERKMIHKIARKNNLTSKSYGKDESRYLVVFRKLLDAQSIVSDLTDAGGKIGGMQLINPGAQH